MRASEVMVADPIVAVAGAMASEVAIMFRSRNISVVPVVDDHRTRRFLGTLSDRELVTRCLAEGKHPWHTRADCADAHQLDRGRARSRSSRESSSAWTSSPTSRTCGPRSPWWTTSAASRVHQPPRAGAGIRDRVGLMTEPDAVHAGGGGAHAAAGAAHRAGPDAGVPGVARGGRALRAAGGGRGGRLGRDERASGGPR